MVDLNAALAQLGPWGILIGFVLPYAIQYIKARLNKPAAPVDPSPAKPEPVNPSPAPVSSTPILDAVLAILRSRLAPKLEAKKVGAVAAPEPAADISHDDAAAILARLGK